MTDTGGKQSTVGGVVDIVFVIDCTRSMHSCIIALKDNIRTFIDSLTTKDANDTNPVRDWRASVVGYRDFKEEGPSRWLENHPFVKDPAVLKDHLASLNAEGGGDEPESLLDALFVVANMEECDKGDQTPDPRKWRHRRDAARVVIVFSDATFHATMSVPGATGGGVNDLGMLIAAKRIFLSIFAPEFDCYADLAAIDRSEYESIPFDKATGPQQALANYTSDKENFSRVMKQLAASVTKTASVPPL